MIMHHNIFRSLFVMLPCTHRTQFSDLPEKWITLRKTATHIKYEIVPIQAYQVDMIRKRIVFFNLQTKHFRESFKKMKVSHSHVFARTRTIGVFVTSIMIGFDVHFLFIHFQFFLIPCTRAYDLLDNCNKDLLFLERQQHALVDSASIFGLALPSEQELTKCRNDIKLAKVFISCVQLIGFRIRE